MKSYQQFLAELKRRKVFKVAAVYGVVAFGLIQVADPLVAALHLPDTFLTYVVAILFLGFPLALVLAWAFEVTPEGVQKTGAAAPGEIEAIVSLPISKRWPAGLIALVGVGALVAGAWWVGRRTAPEAAIDAGATDGQSDIRLALVGRTDDQRPSLAVLPFLDMSPESNQAYFSDGITEEILNTLSRIHELKVAARTSAFAFRGRNLDMRAIGDSLGVDYLIEGSVRKAGNQLRITAQLIDASDGSHVWSDQYDRQMDDIFRIQTEIAEAIAAELRVPLGIEDPAELVIPTADLEAYDLYLAGLGQMRLRGTAIGEAIRLFESAIDRDSLWAPGWAKLAEAREIFTFYPEAWNPPPTDARMIQEVIPGLLNNAEKAARMALALDPDDASAYVALGSILRDRLEWRESEQAYLQALQLDPDYAEAHQQYAELLGATGRTSAGLREAERALALDPAPVRRGIVGFLLTVDGRSEEAIPMLKQTLSEADGQLPLFTSNLLSNLIQLRRFDEAERVAREEGGEFLRYVGALQALRRGSPDAALKASGMGPIEWLWFGEPDSAAAAIPAWTPVATRADAYMVWASLFDPIRDRPEMQDFLRTRNLEGVTLQRTPRSELGSEVTP